MVADSDAVVEPGAVVVETFDAAVADSAVAGAGGAEDQAVGAHLARVDLGQHVEEVLLLDQVAGVTRGRDEEADSDERTQDGDDIGKDVVSLI